MPLGKFISENLDQIMQEWEKFASTVSPGKQSSDPAILRDDVRSILKDIAADLGRPETATDQAEKSKGHRQVSETAGGTHGAQRLAAGFSLNATVAEYRAMRATVIRLWQEANRNSPAPKTEVQELIRFNEAIDQAVGESVDRFSFEKEQQFRTLDTLLSSTPDFSFTFDLNCRFTYANKALRELLGVPLDKIIGKSPADLGMRSAAKLYTQIKEVIRTHKPSDCEYSFTIDTESERCYEYILAPVFDEMETIDAVAGTARNVTERKDAENINWEKAHYDPLTGLPNRRLFSDRLVEYAEHAKRLGSKLALLFIDLDHFKEANDLFGHDAGDLLLSMTAERLLACVRSTDLTARLGGDEFTVILQDLRGPGIELITEKLRRQMAEPFQLGDDTAHISASIGIAIFPDDADTAVMLIKCADQAMYAAKDAGGNQFSFCSPNPGSLRDFKLTHHADRETSI